MPRSACPTSCGAWPPACSSASGGARLGLKLDDRATEIIGTVALSLFLGMTMMTLDLSSVARLAGPLALMLAVQTLFCALYASWSCSARSRL